MYDYSCYLFYDKYFHCLSSEGSIIIKWNCFLHLHDTVLVSEVRQKQKQLTKESALTSLIPISDLMVQDPFASPTRSQGFM